MRSRDRRIFKKNQSTLFSKIRRSRDLLFLNSNLFLVQNLMVELKIWNSNFLESVGIKFETNQFLSKLNLVSHGAEFAKTLDNGNDGWEIWNAGGWMQPNRGIVQSSWFSENQGG